MAIHLAQQIVDSVARTYTVYVPDNPIAAVLPAIVAFHGGGGDVKVIAKRWGVDPPNPVPANVADYILVFPESHPGMGTEWVHFGSDDSGFPTLDLDFVEQLVAELTTRQYPTASLDIPTVSADPALLYAAGFSNGGGMVWQILYSPLSAAFRGFAAVGKALDPEKVQHYRKTIGAGVDPAPAPVVYIQGTADSGFRPPFTLQETALDTTLPAFTMREMLDRNQIPANAPATTRLVAGSTGVTEVVVQLFEGGAEAFLMGTVINGGHNWPTPTTRGNPPVAEHFDATATIVDFWHQFAGLP